MPEFQHKAFRGKQQFTWRDHRTGLYLHVAPKRKKFPEDPEPESTPKLTSELAATAELVPAF